MVDFQYTTVPGKITTLFEKIRTVGVPQKVTVQWLRSIGFTSSNDTTLLTMTKAVGFADVAGVPTDYWKHYRGGDHKTVMASAIRENYRELFEVYPDAWLRPDKDLENFFSTRSSAGKQVISKTVSTFKNLAALAEFGAEVETAAKPGRTPSGQHAKGSGGSGPLIPPPPVHQTPVGPALHIDIQIHISSDANAQQIDQIFASMAKHLYKNGNA
jgi:Family of unknown function (DUF5343)